MRGVPELAAYEIRTLRHAAARQCLWSEQSRVGCLDFARRRAAPVAPVGGSRSRRAPASSSGATVSGFVAPAPPARVRRPTCGTALAPRIGDANGDAADGVTRGNGA